MEGIRIIFVLLREGTPDVEAPLPDSKDTVDSFSPNRRNKSQILPGHLPV